MKMMKVDKDRRQKKDGTFQRRDSRDQTPDRGPINLRKALSPADPASFLRSSSAFILFICG
jgi:hypothetical protein